MKLFKEGDTSRAICETCKRVVATRFDRRTVNLKNPEVAVPEVLVAICETCGRIVAIPHQSTPRLQEARREASPKHEARIPSLLNDAIGMIAEKFSVRSEEFGGMLVRFYLNRMIADSNTAKRLKVSAESPLAKGKGTERIALRVNKLIWDNSWSAARNVGFRSTSDLFRGAITLAAIDSGIADAEGLEPSLEFRTAIETIAMAAPDAPAKRLPYELTADIGMDLGPPSARQIPQIRANRKKKSLA